MSTPANLEFRSGIGFDSHPLTEGRRLVLGGVEVPHDKGLSGHSDGDVLVHAVMDALLGAANLGDKGLHFPSSDSQYKDISSLLLLERVGVLVAEAGWRLSNVDATILAQNPRLSPFNAEMRENVAKSLSVSPDRVSVKVTTTDHLGFVGREEGIAACAVASLMSGGP
ncbi:MAG: 2-C-methyl-D-erythritol 2,4-cyclodiphosphate synthase [SAR202 cluster bacterium]|nr:2-C-methyl-D-erythritol 2,4-cyclodiphosphate synthase [Verrucomicrobiales bacterium]MQF94257.1 2-C-methyl-D-erythritol 2,4-cyclodiphosphate synthase [SAR202 cluster bacterium]MQG33252.1 2-C-methyl-D-erythritol 2,4-cyclodiphosphate synthase [SAR202 cluster bacterium]HAA95655.1 2-C-methyl-D-erythritol 2,4-cyclodiphosphate synthase [Dehalococcoidia bacterium]HCP23952.1 2-C-methyl-D-erythritol 2,4-cyclodiphosphate synthase [Dehalococcoidia bacterium]|tara:strand:+ start:1734 stop:2237 length:504 start_codon:yes stop_codon:yes gene_type:complete